MHAVIFHLSSERGRKSESRDNAFGERSELEPRSGDTKHTFVSLVVKQ
jgi:hypothetical protein